MQPSTWRQVDRAELLRLSGEDPFLRWGTDDRVLAIAGPAGWAWLHPWRPGGRHWGGAFVGPDHDGGALAGSALSRLISLAQARGVTPEWFSTTDSSPLPLPAGWEQAGVGEWHFMWAEDVTERAPTELTFIELDDAADAATIDAFGQAHNAAFEGFPGIGYALLWLGIRERGELVAIGALHALATGVPHLAGIVTHTERRGQGLGRAMVTELTRRAIAVAGVSTLGVTRTNTAAVRLYQRLGYRTAHTFRTADLTR
ncbi:GNAT family N-acetyltransferase [Ruania zhangjianzhongii]|uniref:GNAT family N-acetyltransferase n=1 Tax=Ruania zhangjianzhongii TaxID=2603206 RepID=UPI0011CA5C45|nr:GNAT family N-acetyltransferase [Ruania zhangjianzhongii]